MASVILSGWIATAVVGVLVGVVILTSSILIHQAALVLTLPYRVLWCAYIPRGFVRLWNGMGDYSYGIYIYGFPVHAALAATGVTATPAASFFGTLLCVTPIALASWHLPERLALRIPLPGQRVSTGDATVSWRRAA
jgi:peptidoglycan/LPS O-acetylase OafA/YrhL